MVSLDTMRKAHAKTTVSRLLLDAFGETDESIRAVGRATAISHPSLVRFIQGKQDLKLSSAEALMEHFGIVAVRARGRKRARS